MRRRSGQTVRHHGKGAGAVVGVSGAAQRRQKRRSGGLGVPQAEHGTPATSSLPAAGRTTGRGATALAGRTGCGEATGEAAREATGEAAA
nr:hypothetical protein OG409_36515 [Streptomyces sp. NBC_00974]